jgi:outer membrane protein
MYKGLLLFGSLLFVCSSKAQHFTFQQCIDSALAHYIPVKQSGLQAENAKVAWQQAKANVLPFVSGSVFHGIYQGRSIDPSSNSYVNQNLGSAVYQVSTGITVFNGGSIQNFIRQNATAYEASKQEWQQSKDNLVLDVILAYLQVLNNEDVLASVKQQATVSSRQLERLEILDSLGAIKPSDVTDLKGQLLNDQASIATAINAVETAKINLSRLMNRPFQSTMQIDRIPLGELLENYSKTPDEVYGQALEKFAQIQAAALRRESFFYGVKTARGALAPTVSINSGFNSNYSSIAQTVTGKIPYNTQLFNNISSSVGLGVSIPIFNRWLVRNRVKVADIALRNSELEEANTRVVLRQQIDQAYSNMTASYNRYKLLAEQVTAYTVSFKAAEVRFDAGVGNSVDFLLAKDRLDRATINFISAKYDFVLRKKILDYYYHNLPTS